MEALPKIPSEYIEPYIKAFLMENLKLLSCDAINIKEFREFIIGIHEFVQFSCGIHAKIASDNILLFKTLKRSDEELMNVAKKIYNQ